MVTDSTREAIQSYKDHRLDPGGFLRAVLENDLTSAVKRADDLNRRYLSDVVTYCYQVLPSASWGNRGLVASWLHDRRRRDFEHLH